jgi:hypothetical protein
MRWLKLKSRHRITLTNNLYVSEYIGGILQRYSTFDPILYPLVEVVRAMVQQPGCMTEGK